MSTLLADIASSEGLRTAALLGLGGLLVGLIASGLSPGRRPPPIGGALVAAAALPVLWWQFPMPVMVAIGCIAMAAGSLFGKTIGERFLGSLVGALVVTFAAGTDAAIHPAVTGVGLAICTALVVDHDEDFQANASTMPLFLGSAIGVLFTVPDTERAMVLVGAALPLAFLGWPVKLASFGPAGAAAIGVLGYIAVTAVRAGAVVGALGSLGLLLVEPVGRRLARRQPTALHTMASTRRIGFYVFVIIHGIVVLGASRVAGLRQSALAAVVLLIPFLVFGVILSAAPGRAPASASARSETLEP